MLRVDDPSFLLVMNCDICSSLPIGSMLEFQERKQAQLTIMTTEDDTDENHGFGAFIQDSQTQEMVHYTEGGKRSNLPVNCGVYLLSTYLLHDHEFIRSIQQKSDKGDKTKQKNNLA
mmetsp:Transcript_28892/g.33937  ORF Transcript_28892/g.33937 Transcript_28892/m.33937 type:complete len:117 (-) Transcript_28892:172-522(-)